MAGIKAQFSDVFPYDRFLLVSGSYGPTQLPNVGCGLVRFKARAANTGSFFLGHESGTAATLPFQLSAGEDTGWVATDNLNRYWYKGASGTTDLMAIWTQQ